MSRLPQRPFLTRRALTFGALAAGASALFIGAAEAAVLTVRGEVMYRERMALPPGARILVQLADVSRADAPARIVATARTGKAQGSPIPFTLRVDSRKLAKGRRYVLQARISDSRGQLMFINDTAHPWTPGAAGPAIVRVVRAGAGKAKAPPTPWGSWLAEDILGGGVLDRAQSRLEIAPDGRVSGHGGCNGLNGHARVSGRRIVFSRMASTMKACSPALMDQERKFHEALGLTRSFRVEAEQKQLFLLDGSNRVVMRLSAMG